MKPSTKSALGLLVAFAAVGLGSDNVWGQNPGIRPENRPAYSPYLNLLRNGNSPALNYYGIVRPQLNFMNSINNVQQQVTVEQQTLNDLQAGNLPTTGHSAMFLNTRGYFQSGMGRTGTSNRAIQTRGNAPGMAGVNSGGVAGRASSYSGR